VTKKIWGVVVVLAVLVGVGAVLRARRAPEVTYREITLAKGDLNVSILSTGTVQPQNRLEIKPPIAGRVETVLVKEGQTLRKGQVLAWMSSTERAALIDAARSQGADELKKWEELYRPTPILAPIRGSLILRNVESGQTFTATDSVFVMSDRLIVKAQVDETDIAQVKVGQTASLVLDAYPGQPIAAHADKIAYDAKTVNNVTIYNVDVLPDETPPYMRSGMTANVSFLTQSKKDVLIVPTEAVQYREGKAFVLTPSAAKRQPPIETPIELGLSDGKRSEVLSGVAEGATVLMVDAPNLSGPKGGANSNPFMPMAPPSTRSRGR